ncbi:MAG: histidine--tRNA ligase [Planctomycetes bacterium]|nr:histidine--tRNA ligase [Planctomycetota bacterium]
MSKKDIRAIEGTRDYLGEDGIRFEKAMDGAREIFTRFGFEKIATPVFESTDLFARSIGEATDIVEKEMYTFKPGSEMITLRPEGTAGAIRAYLQHNLHKQGSLTKLWYAGPMFRRERPQKGRYRQFHQVGIEAVGSSDPLLDTEVIAMGIAYYERLGITGIRLRLNSIGCSKDECRPAYRAKLRAEIEPNLDKLCKTCNSRFERNALRILDCKNPHCQEVVKGLPASYDNLCEECEDHFAKVKEGLAAQGIEFDVDATLVRGLDYYSKTVFEYTHGALGAQDAIGGGGRYDGLVEELGGPATPAVGFAIGVERAMIAMEALGACCCAAPLSVFGIGLGEDCHKAMSGMITRLRREGISADMDYEGRSFKSQMRLANRKGAQVALILGDNELAEGKVNVKDMREGGEQLSVNIADAISEVKKLLP